MAAARNLKKAKQTRMAYTKDHTMPMFYPRYRRAKSSSSNCSERLQRNKAKTLTTILYDLLRPSYKNVSYDAVDCEA
jgi:hypothetical protein